MLLLLLLFVFYSPSLSQAFQSPVPRISSVSTFTTYLYGPVSTFGDGMEEEAELDRRARSMATDCYLKLTGLINKNGEPESRDFIRYNQAKELDSVESVTNSNLQVLAQGHGIEEFVDPGEGLQKIVINGPLEAANSTLKSLSKSLSGYKTLVVNVCAGDDTLIQEEMDAISFLIRRLKERDLELTRTRVLFHCVTHDTLPLGEIAFTLVGLKKEEISSTACGCESGEIYIFKDRCMTFLENDINKDME